MLCGVLENFAARASAQIEEGYTAYTASMATPSAGNSPTAVARWAVVRQVWRRTWHRGLSSSSSPLAIGTTGGPGHRPGDRGSRARRRGLGPG